MTNDPKTTFPIFHSPDAAPFIYFDVAPTYGIMSGAVQVEVASRVLVPIEGGAKAEFIITGHLRCSPAAATDLRDALTKALDMLQQLDEPQTAAASKLN